jgi:hypothetical protein
MWRFRKVFNLGRFRTSLSKKGIGYSYGFFGFRFGVSPSGSKYISFGIPGTGLYFIKYLNSNSQNSIPQHNNQATQNLLTNNPKSTQKVEWWKQKGLDKF